jgi:cysteine sulfinate desulfinase/cysteine desulfurase-like protein
MSLPVYALTGDKRAALSTLRVSLSRHTTAEDITGLLAALPQAIAEAKENA